MVRHSEREMIGDEVYVDLISQFTWKFKEREDSGFGSCEALGEKRGISGTIFAKLRSPMALRAFHRVSGVNVVKLLDVVTGIWM